MRSMVLCNTTAATLLASYRKYDGMYFNGWTFRHEGEVPTLLLAEEEIWYYPTTDQGWRLVYSPSHSQLLTALKELLESSS